MACLGPNDQRPDHFFDQKNLAVDIDLKFLAKLDLAELSLLVACIRERMEDEKR